MEFGYLFLVVHLLPTMAVLGAGYLVWRAVSVRVTWRRSAARHLDDTLA